jgi:hypothetical protein
MLDIPGLRALCEAATPEEWTGFLVKPELFNSHLSSVRSVEGYAIALDMTQADAAFVAASRTALPAALAEVEALREKVAQLQTHFGRAGDLRNERDQAIKALKALRDSLGFLPMSWEEVCDEETSTLVKFVLGEDDDESEEA